MQDKTRKVRSLTVDTNVILDLPKIVKFSKEDAENVNKMSIEKREDFERADASYQSIMMCLTLDIETPFVEMVCRELYKSPILQGFYKETFTKKTSVRRMRQEVSRLSQKYIERTHLGKGDSIVLATVILNRVDFFLSWNRKDILNPNVIKEVRAINDSRNLPTPEIIDPYNFVIRVVVPENSKGFMFSPTPTLPVYRPRFELPKA